MLFMIGLALFFTIVAKILKHTRSSTLKSLGQKGLRYFLWSGILRIWLGVYMEVNVAATL